MSMYGGIETGGTKWALAVGTGPEDLHASQTLPTTTPGETLDRAVAFFEQEGPVDAIGVGSFGPIDQKPESPTWGYITSTPKPGWAYTDVGQEIRRRLDVPVAFDTDVNAAALGEHRWGAAQGLDTFSYITVGAGIGGGGMARGRLLHGLVHPEFGHLRIPHDRDYDPFEGVCPYHRDCWEGLASAIALERRWGAPPVELDDDPRIWQLEAEYLGLGVVAVTCILSPERIILGGGVMERPQLVELVRHEVHVLLNDYLDAPSLRDGLESYVTLPELGPRAGVLGAIALAETA